MTDKQIILDEGTLEFCINIAWQYKFLSDTKHTKKSMLQSECFQRVIETLEHYKDMTDNPNVIVKNTNEREGINVQSNS